MRKTLPKILAAVVDEKGHIKLVTSIAGKDDGLLGSARPGDALVAGLEDHTAAALILGLSESGFPIHDRDSGKDYTLIEAFKEVVSKLVTQAYHAGTKKSLG
jgi:hypothetical protein